jgi:hypothetical protein
LLIEKAPFYVVGDETSGKPKDRLGR